MRRLLAILLVLVLVALPRSARATSAESANVVLDPVELASMRPHQVLDAEPDAAPELAGAYSSLYQTNEQRRQTEGKALARSVLGSLLGLAAGGLGAAVTFGVGIVGVPIFVALGAAWGVEPYFDARYGWMFMGGLVGLSTAVPVVVGMVRIVNWSNEPGVSAIAVLLALLASVVGPGIGATVAAITDQDNIQRTGERWKLGLASVEGPVHDGAGVELRF